MENAIITFKNAVEVTAEVNGNCYITDTKPEFPKDLSEVTVTIGDNKKTLKAVEVIEAGSDDGRYWFALRQLSEAKLRELKTQADIQYIAMMADIEL